MSGTSTRQARGRAARGGAPSWEAGFTLIELLVVLVILGLVATIALPRFWSARERAYQTQMLNDLRSLATAEEAYFDSFMTYSTSTTDLKLVLTEGVDLDIEASGRGWTATATHSAIPVRCGLYYGEATAPAGITVPGEGVIACD